MTKAMEPTQEEEEDPTWLAPTIGPPPLNRPQRRHRDARHFQEYRANRPDDSSYFDAIPILLLLSGLEFPSCEHGGKIVSAAAEAKQKR
jgi:hypothetical protein